MLKMAGAVLIIAGTTVWGACSVMKMRGRVRSLNSLVWALKLMGEEICANLTPMPEVLALVGSAAPKPAAELFARARDKLGNLGSASFRELWRQVVDETPSLLLENDELEILVQLGGELGKYDFESQRRIIRSAVKRLELKAENAERERAANSRLHAFLGIAAGMFAVVVLI